MKSVYVFFALQLVFDIVMYLNYGSFTRIMRNTVVKAFKESEDAQMCGTCSCRGKDDKDCGRR